MSESFEQYFAQTPKKPKSPEQIKEEKALKLVEEIKKIEERMKKEGETPEGYQRMTELLRQIQEMYEEKREFVSERAKEIYQSLKNTPLWDKEKKEWNGYMDEKENLKDSDRYSDGQLLGVLAEAVTGNLEEAKEIYQSLKNTPLWDKEKKQWNWWMDKEGELKSSDRYSEAQLLGVLAEAVDEKGEEFIKFLTKK